MSYSLTAGDRPAAGLRQVLTTTCLLLVLGAPALANDAGMAKVGDVTIHDAWARASLGSVPNSAAYMILETSGDAPDKLITASSPVAKTAGMHTHNMEGGIAKMRPVAAIELSPGEPTVLQPGGLHVMLMGLTQKLEEGDKLQLTLTFETAGEVTLEVPVHSATGAMQHGAGHQPGS